MTDLLDATAGPAVQPFAAPAPTSLSAFPPPVPTSVVLPTPTAPPAAPPASLPMLDLAPAGTPTTEIPVIAKAAPGLVAPVPQLQSAAPPQLPSVPTPQLLSGPAAVLSADPAFMPLEHSVPSLPAVMLTKPPNTAAAALGAAGKSPLALDGFDFGSPSTTQKKKKKNGKSGFRRAVTRVIMLGVLGGGGYFGYTDGPRLYDQYIAKTGDSAAGEPEAPLAYPTSPVVPVSVRTANFVLSGLTGSADAEYAVTIDFETNVSRVEVSRGEGPDLEVLTLGNDAVVRRVGATQWYQVQRGTFPLDDQLERADWVRTLDELLPPQVRAQTTITRSTQAVIADVPVRHLQVSVEASLLADAHLPMPTLDPVTGLPVADPLAVPVAADPFAAPVTADAPTITDPTQPGDVQIEIWVDSNGLIRQITGAPQLGAEKITVNSTSDQAYIPEFPGPDLVQPLTASALVELGM